MLILLQGLDALRFFFKLKGLRANPWNGDEKDGCARRVEESCEERHDNMSRRTRSASPVK